jgi:hypothetical protein
MDWHRVVRVWAVCVWASSQAVAQSPLPERPLPVAGTLLYNLLFMSHPQDENGGGIGARFGGRFALRVRARTYVGLGVGSWLQAQTGECSLPFQCGTVADYWSEAIAYQVYAQHTPAARFPGWLRFGVGIANTSTLVPGGGVISVSDRWRAIVSGGAGVDLRVGGHLFVTPSLDYTQLVGVERRGQELRHALALGFGMTIR